MFPGLPARNPLTDPAFDDPVGKEKAEYAGNEKEPVEDCFWHWVWMPQLLGRHLELWLVAIAVHRSHSLQWTLTMMLVAIASPKAGTIPLAAYTPCGSPLCIVAW